MAVLRESPWYKEILTEGDEQGFERGIGQGIEQGIEQGQEAEAANMVLRVLEHRFGATPPSVEQGIRQLPLATLRQLIDVALDARTLDEVLIVVGVSPNA